MAETIHIVFVLVLIVTVIYIIAYVIYPSTGNEEKLKVMTPLSTKTIILESDSTQQMILGSSGSAVMAFVKLNGGDRTTKYENQYTPLIYVDNNWFLEMAPAPAGKSESSARLRVRTNHANTIVEEKIDLPPIPKQKWVFLAILREGRRFDVIYDNKIVASQRLENYPVVISSPLTAGNKGIDGSIIHAVVNGKRISPSEADKVRLSHVDTNGTVIEGNPFNISLPNLSLLVQCPPGLPCNPVTKPPSNHLREWSTPYA